MSTEPAAVADLYEFGIAPGELARRFGWAILGLGLIRGKGIVTLPLALWVLGAAGYGQFTVVLAAASAIAPFALLNVPDGAGRMIVSAPGPEIAEERLGAIRRASVLAALALAGSGVALGAALGSSLVAWSGALAGVTVLFKGASVHLEYFQRTRRLVRIQIISEYIAVVVGLALAVTLGVPGMLGALVAVGAVAAFVAWRTLRVPIRQPLRARFWRPAVRLSLPLMPVAVAQWALYSLDSLLVYRLLGKTETGAYSAAYSIAALALLLPFGLNAIWSMSAQRLLSQGVRELVRYTRLITCGLLVVGALIVTITIVARPLIGVALSGHTYDAVPACVPWIAVGFVSLAFAKLFEGVVYAYGHTLPILAAYGLGAIANLVLNLVWIPRFGIVGAAYATAAGYALTAGVVCGFAVLVISKTSSTA